MLQFGIPFWDFVAHGKAFRNVCGALWLLWRVQGSSEAVFAIFLDAKGKCLRLHNVVKVQ